ncbi:MAG TPA: AI-2E family transporter [Thermoanaerobaculia bacterium]
MHLPSGMDGKLARAEEREPEPEKVPGRTRARLLAVIAAVLVLAFLKWSAVVTMPLGLSLFLIALGWPLQERLERRLPRKAAFLLTVLTMLLIFAAFVGSLVWSGRLIAERAPQYSGKVKAVYAQVQERARDYGISLPGAGQGGQGSSAQGLVISGLKVAGSSISLALLIAAFVILGLYEVHDFKDRTRGAFRQPRHGAELIETSRALCERYMQYLRVFTLTALIQGVVVFLFALLVGLDFAFVWGLLAFLLNYVPTVGSVIAVVPPSLFALVQFDNLSRALLVCLGMAALQLICGNYIDPLLKGRFLKLSPVVVLISITFWGWIWGIPGAFLGVPITIGLVIAADHFPNTRWIARLLSQASRRRYDGGQEETT